MVHSGRKRRLRPSRVAMVWALGCSSFTAPLHWPRCRRGLARFVMTSSLLRRLCQQFKMALILRACSCCELFCPDTSKWKNILDGARRRSQSLHHKCVLVAIHQHYRKTKNKCCSFTGGWCQFTMWYFCVELACSICIVVSGLSRGCKVIPGRLGIDKG